MTEILDKAKQWLSPTFDTETQEEITQLIIGVFLLDWLPYLWLNLVGCALVMGIAIIIQFFISIKKKDAKNTAPV